MIPFFSKVIDAAVDRRFTKDRSGRLVFIPLGLKQKCYFVDSKADEEKIRALVRMFQSAIAVIPLVTYPIAAFPGLILEDHGGLSPRGHRLTIALGIPLFLFVVLALFMWMLWSLYKKAIPGLTASLSEVGPDVRSDLRRASQPMQRSMALIAAGLIVVLAVLVFLVSYRK
jgi:lysylphosphatidylglycerol synthetase-like protein (DUF2156 family)